MDCVEGKRKSDFCQLCSEENKRSKADGICRECQQFMCQTCYQHHLKASVCRTHVLLDPRDTNIFSTTDRDIEQCDKHVNETVRFYCRKHDQIGCGDCMLFDGHGSCQPEYIKDVSINFRRSDEFKSLTNKLQKLESDNAAVFKKVHNNVQSNKEMDDELVADVKSFRKRINDYFDKAEAENLTFIEKKFSQYSNLLKQLETECNDSSSELEEHKKKLNEECNTDRLLFIHSVVAKSKLQQLERSIKEANSSCEVDRLEFKPDKQLSEILSSFNSLGSFEKVSNRDSPCLESNPVPATERIHTRKALKDGKRGRPSGQKGVAYGWDTVGAIRTPLEILERSIYPPEMKQYKQHVEESSIHRCPGGGAARFAGWGRGSTGGITGKSSQEKEQPNAPTNRPYKELGRSRYGGVSPVRNEGRSFRMPPSLGASRSQESERERAVAVKAIGTSQYMEGGHRDIFCRSAEPEPQPSPVQPASAELAVHSETEMEKKTKVFLDQNFGINDMKGLKYTSGVYSAPTTPTTRLPLNEIEVKLHELIVLNKADNETIVVWFEKNVDEPTTKRPKFIRALMTAVCYSAIKGDKGKERLEPRVISMRNDLIQKYLDHQADSELQALYAVQALIAKLGHPAGVLRGMFDTFYDEDIISEDAFFQWEKSKEEPEGKDVCLKQAIQFFKWLREDEEDY